MTTFSANGIIRVMGQVASGKTSNGYDWQRQDIVIEVTGNGDAQGRPQFLSMSAMNRTVDELNGVNIGDHVSVECEISAREYNGRWYNNVNVARLTVDHPVEEKNGGHADMQSSVPEGGFEPQKDDLPF